MSYDFASLLPADFEDLARDLVGEMIGERLEAFGPGPDGGIDGRHAAADGDVIMQAKHYGGSSFNQLAATMRKEREAIDRLGSARYILATARNLSPGNKASLAAIIGSALKRQSDILGRDDLNRLLRDHPQIERAHLKLWLSGTTVLETILGAIVHSGSHAFTASGAADIGRKVRVYAPNPSLAQARKVLEERHVLIVSGPPGVGKTTLAEILTFAYGPPHGRERSGAGQQLAVLHGVESIQEFTPVDRAVALLRGRGVHEAYRAACVEASHRRDLRPAQRARAVVPYLECVHDGHMGSHCPRRIRRAWSNISPILQWCGLRPPGSCRFADPCALAAMPRRV